MSLDLLTEIYSSFEPFQPPSKEAYVDCQEVRGGWEVVRELGRKITRSKQPTCQLYTGHRGVGKSTELLRLCEYLEQEKYCVVYFAADNEDIKLNPDYREEAKTDSDFDLIRQSLRFQALIQEPEAETSDNL